MPVGVPKYGLKAFIMERVGKVVVLAGKNGAGKTRFLRRLSSWLSENMPHFGTLNQLNLNRQNIARSHLPARAKNEGSWWLEEAVWTSIVKLYNIEPSAEWLPQIRENIYHLEFSSDETPVFVEFVPKRIDFVDPNLLSPKNLNERARAVEKVGMLSLNENVLARVQAIQNRYYAATHPRSTIAEPEKGVAIRHYEGLQEVVRRFLRTEITRSINDYAELFGREIGTLDLSDGQKVLLQFCVAIHAQAEKLSSLIIVMDEPENHLHPEAMLDSISAIENSLTDGQIWIATHSIPLLAHFDPDSIWWMEDGLIQHAGSQPEKVLAGLIGGGDRIEKLSDFLGLPAVMAANNFAFQCLLPPNVFRTDNRDPQTYQIQKLMGQKYNGTAMRILDFGAGRGRLISAMRENWTDIEKLKAEIDYIAFDISKEFSGECKDAVSRVYGNSENRYFNEERVLRENLAKGSVDVLVMCNVFHEIAPGGWLNLFSESGLIRSALKPDGFLLVVEDMEMRIGEKAHQGGFLVLDSCDLKLLFRIPERDSGFSVDDARNDGRLKAHCIPAKYLAGASIAALKETLEQVRHLAKEEIKTLRSSVPTYREGRKHAFYVHQFANASLALETLGVE